MSQGNMLTPDSPVLAVTNQISSGVLVSGLVTQNYLAAESVRSGHVGSGAVVGNGIAGKRSVASGSLDRVDQNSGCVVDYFACEEAISGVRAVAWGSGGCFLVNAQRGSGLRLPAVGVAVGNYASGAVVSVITKGLVGVAFSGGAASGFFGSYLYVGSGGLLINQSGFMGGSSSGQGAAPTPAASGYSGSMVQPVGVSVSGGLFVQVGEIRSGLLSGLLGAY